MEEQLRQAYLRAMDIDIHYSRRQREQAQFQTEEAGESPKSIANITAAQTIVAKTRPARATEPVPAAESVKTPAADMASAGSANLKSVAAEPEIRLLLRFAWLSDELAVIEELPYARNESDTAARDELLRAITAALGVNHNAADVRYESIRWPIAEGLDGSADAAKGMLLGFLEKRRQLQSFENLLLFSPQLAGLLPLRNSAATEGMKDGLAEGLKDSGDGVLALSANAQLATTATHSLTALLAHAELKKETWHHLQPLRLRLNGRS